MSAIGIVIIRDVVMDLITFSSFGPRSMHIINRGIQNKCFVITGKADIRELRGPLEISGRGVCIPIGRFNFVS